MNQVVSTFISHTIASVLLVPIASEVGKNLPIPHPRCVGDHKKWDVLVLHYAD